MTTRSQQFKDYVSIIPLNRAYTWFIALWVLGMISVPIALWIWGDGIIPAASTITSLLQCIAVFVILQEAWGTRRTLITFVVVAVLTWSAEALGSHTGFPFGSYDYTPALQPQILGVPMLIPVAWFMMLGPAWGIAYTIVGGDLSTLRRRLTFIGLSAAAITAWDLFLDPQMVGWGFWVWENPSGYFGIPWVNFGGWLLTAAVVTAVVRPDRLPVDPLIVVYGIVWVLQTIGLAVFWGQPLPALCGSLAMGTLLLLAGRARQRRSA